DLEALAVGARHHDRRVPADEGADAALEVLVAGEPGLALRRDRVDVVGAAQRRDADLVLARPLEQLEHDVAGPRFALLGQQGVEGVDPLLRLLRVDVGQLGRQTLVDHRRPVTSRCHTSILPPLTRSLTWSPTAKSADETAAARFGEGLAHKPRFAVDYPP